MISRTTAPTPETHYPESDGLPLADNTKQLEWMFEIFNNLRLLFHERQDVFVACNLFWYPVEGHPEIRVAPDALVAFGRPKGHRGSYQQWLEDNVPLTVVFEVLSPGNTALETTEKFSFYAEYGVEEYYIIDPDTNQISAYVRRRDTLARVRDLKKFVSPRLGVRIERGAEAIVFRRPDGIRFQSFEELAEQKQAAIEAVERSTRRTARLAELSRKARRQQATPEELKELEQLEDESLPS